MMADYQSKRKARRQALEKEAEALQGDGLSFNQILHVFSEAGTPVSKGYLSKLANSPEKPAKTPTKKLSDSLSKEFPEPQHIEFPDETSSQSVRKLAQETHETTQETPTGNQQQEPKFPDNPLRETTRSSRPHPIRTTFRVSIPILEDRNSDKPWDKSVELTNWTKHVLYFNAVSVVKNIHCVEVNLRSREYERNPSSIEKMKNDVYTVLSEVALFLDRDYGLTVDLAGASIPWQELANPSPEYEEAVSRNRKHTVHLSRPSDTPLGPAEAEARAWYDRSPNLLEIETNDMTYEERLLLLPEYAVQSLRMLSAFSKDVKLYSENIVLHMAVLKNMDTTQSKTQETLGSIQQSLTQLVGCLASPSPSKPASEAKAGAGPSSPEPHIEPQSDGKFPTLEEVRRFWRGKHSPF